MRGRDKVTRVRGLATIGGTKGEGGVVLCIMIGKLGGENVIQGGFKGANGKEGRGWDVPF